MGFVTGLIRDLGLTYSLVGGVVAFIIGGAIAFKADSKIGYVIMALAFLFMAYAMRVNGLV